MAPPNPTGEVMQQANEIGKDEHVRGPDNAALTVIEYGDFQCPYCARAHLALTELGEDLGEELGGIRLVFRHLPLVDFHPLAEHAAEAAEAAAAQGKFWDMHDALFEEQDEIGDEQDLQDLAESLGLDGARFRADIEGGQYRARVQADRVRAARDGAHRTPTFFINGVLHQGDSDFDSLERALSAARKKA
jgi:protein-disulfide isomerase